MLKMPVKIDKSDLAETIESLREEMIRVGTLEGLSSPKTIEVSQKLDGVIALYFSVKQ